MEDKRRERQRRYAEKNRVKESERQRKYRKKRKEMLSKREQIDNMSFEGLLDKRRERQRRYAKRNHEKELNRQRQYHKENSKKLSKNRKDISMIIKKKQMQRVENISDDQLIKKRTKDLIRKRKGIIYKKKIHPENTEYYDIGDMDYVCGYCRAVFWTNDYSKKSCCHGGKVSLPELSPYPKHFQSLLNDSMFRNTIRYYNSRFAFTTFKTTFVNNPGRGVYNLKIQGQVYHCTPTTLYPKENERPKCGQIYIYDDHAALKERIQKNPHLKSATIMKINSELKKINPFVQKYKHLHQCSKKSKNYCLYFVRSPRIDMRRYNEPARDECAALIISKDGSVPTFDLCVYPKNCDKNNTTIRTLSKLSSYVDPMTFPLLFPSGDFGWNPELKQTGNNTKRLSILQFYSYRLAYRPLKGFNPILRAGRLTQQYVIHAYIMVESTRLDFFRRNQKQLRIECYQGIVDHVKKSALNNSETFQSKERLGNVFILPSSFIGSPRHMHQNYQDGMAIIRAKGKPDYFITVTCNPNWPELKRVLSNFPVGTTVNDIPTIVCRLFYIKIRCILNDILSGNIFGPVLGYIYTIEFQKRGLPHMHLLLMVHPRFKIKTPEDVDKYIRAEIPRKGENDRLRHLVIKHMLHGPHKITSPCLKTGDVDAVCTKKFPKFFCDETTFNKNGYPIYKRTDNRDEEIFYNSKVDGSLMPVDNRWVVAYNEYLIERYCCHINVESCYSEMAVKYINKYIHKGHDRALIGIKPSGNETVIHDEISTFLDSRYVGPMEAAWRLQELPLSGRSHAVIRLAIHEEYQQNVTFLEGQEKDVVSDEKKSKTTLTAWFDLNKKDARAHNILYRNIPLYYTFNASKKEWIRRQQYSQTIGRVCSVSPVDVERFHLKLILNRVTGPTSFENLKTYENVQYKTYRETALAMGLVDTDEEIFKLFEEACDVMMPKQLRQFLAFFLIGDSTPNGLQLWEKFKSYFCEGFSNNHEYRALKEIDKILESENFSCEHFNLPLPDVDVIFTGDNEGEIEQLKYETLGKAMKEQLNSDQIHIFETVMDAVIYAENKCFFVDGPGGTGKTFLYKAIINTLLGLNKNVVSVAWTGIASILLPKGSTSHRAFKLPLYFNEDYKTCFIKEKGDRKRLVDTDVIIWDEASMIPKQALEMVDETLKDLCRSDRPFGNKIVLLGGDFRQILPVVKYGNRTAIIEQTIKYSYLWPFFKTMALKKNMRTSFNTYSEWLLKVGDGSIEKVHIVDDWRSKDVCKDVYGVVIDSKEDLSNKAILACHNDDVDSLNEKILKKIENVEHVYYSIDSATHKGVDQTDQDVQLQYQIETLNSITLPNFPNYKLTLKIGAVVMLLRNLSINNGLCNGTRLKITKLFKKNIEAEIMTGEHRKHTVYIPKIKLQTTEADKLPYILHRRQFPITLSFAMTINKSQGQSFDHLGLFIHKPLFSHGQLYVALSRCTSPTGIKIQNKLNDTNEIENIVWKEIF